MTSTSSLAAEVATLRRDKRKFEFLSNHATEAYFLLNRAAEIVYVNPFACALVGYSVDELLGKPFADVEIDHDAKRYETLLITSESRIPETQAKYRRKDGSVACVEVTISRFDYLGEVHLLAAARDVSYRQAVENSLRIHSQELLRSNRELERFAYISSHDLKEPLRMVTVYTQLLNRYLAGHLDETAKLYMDFILKGASRMRTLVDGLETYSNIDKDSAPYSIHSSRELLSSAVESLRDFLKATSSRLVIQADLPSICGNSTQVVLLFRNLIHNAIKFRSQKPPAISITVKEREFDWVFSVADNGIGIHPRYLRRIFLLFRRLHTTREYPGTGMGLSLCKKIVENHGGSIWVESELGKGSTFRFSFPKRNEMGVPAEEERIQDEWMAQTLKNAHSRR